jgi:hypothetical protein
MKQFNLIKTQQTTEKVMLISFITMFVLALIVALTSSSILNWILLIDIFILGISTFINLIFCTIWLSKDISALIREFFKQ